jgi:hypothetical protein
MPKKDNVIQELIARKQKASQIEIPSHIQKALHEIYAHNDQFARTSRERISIDEAVEALGKLGFTTSRALLRKISKQLGRGGYADKK